MYYYQNHCRYILFLYILEDVCDGDNYLNTLFVTVRTTLILSYSLFPHGQTIVLATRNVFGDFQSLKIQNEQPLGTPPEGVVVLHQFFLSWFLTNLLVCSSDCSLAQLVSVFLRG